MALSREIDAMIKELEGLIVGEQTKQAAKRILIKSVEEYEAGIEVNRVQLEESRNALEILQKINDNMVTDSYEYIEGNINSALERIFPDRVRRIKIVEGTHGIHHNLELQLTVEGGYVRSLKTSAGHGVAQCISLLSELCLIVINGGRRFMVIDEVTSGMSANTLAAMEDVLEAFSEIGFQFIVISHGFIPKNSRVLVIQNRNCIGEITHNYIEQNGVYLDGVKDTEWKTVMSNIIGGADEEDGEKDAEITPIKRVDTPQPIINNVNSSGSDEI